MSQKGLGKILSLILWLSFLSACAGNNGSSGPTPTPLPPIVSYEKTIFTVELGSIVSDMNIQGDVVPSVQDELFFQASGIVTRILIKQGDRVKAGDLIAEQQVDDLLNQLEQARIDLELAQATLAKDEAQKRYDLAKAEIEVNIWQARVDMARLELEKAVSQDARENAQLNLVIVEENLALAQLDLQQANEEINTFARQAVDRSQLAVQRLEALIAERRIVAPYDCIILRSTLRSGTKVEAYNSVVFVGDPSEYVIRARYDYDLAHKLNKDSEVRMVLTSDEADQGYSVKYLPDFDITHRKEIGNQATNIEYLFFSMPEDLSVDEFPSGRAVNLKAVLGRKDNVLLLPPAAIREHRGLNFVIVLDGEERRRVDIFEIGLKAIDRWEVVAELKAGDQVLGP